MKPKGEPVRCNSRFELTLGCMTTCSCLFCCKAFTYCTCCPAEVYEAVSNGLLVLFFYAGAHLLGFHKNEYNTHWAGLLLTLSLGWDVPALYLAVGQPFLPPGGSAWAICLVWAASGTAGYLVDKVRLHFPLRSLRSHVGTRALPSLCRSTSGLTRRGERGSCTSPARWA